MNIPICLLWMHILTQELIIGKDESRVGRSLLTVSKSVSKALLEGPLNEISSLPLDEVVEAMKQLSNIKIIPKTHISEVWKLVKGERERESLTVEDLDKMGEFLEVIPDSELFYFNMSDWNLVEYLGKVQTFKKHEEAIFSAALIKAHGFEILRNHSCINRMYGIICGFDTHLIKNIPDNEFLQINEEIFENLHACTMYQKRILLEKAVKPTIFGPPQVWNAETVRKANMLILALKPTELLEIRPPAMKGMKSSILKIMSMELIMSLNTKQIAYLSTEAFLVYKERIFLSSKQIYIKSNISCKNLLFIFILLYLEQGR